MRGDPIESRERPTRTGGDKPAHDDVFLEPLERIFLSIDRRIGKDARGLLEGSRRNEGPRLQACLRDPKQDMLAIRLLTAGGLCRTLGVFELDAVHLLTL